MIMRDIPARGFFWTFFLMGIAGFCLLILTFFVIVPILPDRNVDINMDPNIKLFGLITLQVEKNIGGYLTMAVMGLLHFFVICYVKAAFLKWLFSSTKLGDIRLSRHQENVAATFE